MNDVLIIFGMIIMYMIGFTAGYLLKYVKDSKEIDNLHRIIHLYKRRSSIDYD